MYQSRAVNSCQGRGIVIDCMIPRIPLSPKEPLSHKERSLRYRRKVSSATRDIGEIPSVVNLERKTRGERSLIVFCKEYQPTVFTWPFSPMHKQVIAKLERLIDGGGLFAYAMPRGTGKTSIAEAACLWALLTGRRKYVALISATEKHSQQSLTNIKRELSSNELIYQDWPEVVYPIWSLENIAHRAGGQTYHDEPTYIIWKGEQLVLPGIKGSKAKGSVIEIRGLTGAIRGMKINLPGGRGTIRPELVILDDPQTDESARSGSQCIAREQLILGAILGLTGHGGEISIAMPCTIIHKGDLADRFLDREIHPEWHGVRTQLLKHMPTNTKLWDEYYNLRRKGIDQATRYYIDNQEMMDEGAEALWPECFEKKQISAVQHAMDKKIIVGEQAFWAEYQNAPLDDMADGEMVTVEDILNKTTKYARGQIPEVCQHLTLFIDVHKRVLYWMVCGWEENFNGYVIDYGTWPSASRVFFTMRELRNTLQKKYKIDGVEGAIYAGLKELTSKLLGKTWGTSGLRVERCIIDANWKTSLVKTFCRETEHGAIILPGHGRYIGADRRPLNEYKRYAGDRVGVNWRVPVALGRGATRHVIYDINYWKSFINSALLTPPGERGCLQLFGEADHKLLAVHCTSEYFVETTARGRTINQWQPRPGRDETHWWDCVVGCAVGASMQGCRTIDATGEQRTRMRVSYME